MKPNHPDETLQPIAVDVKTAASMLGIGRTLLWEITAPRGPLRSFRIGRAVRYRVVDLQNYVAELAGETAAGDR